MHFAAIHYAFHAPGVSSTFALSGGEDTVPRLHQIDPSGRVIAQFDPTALVPVGQRSFVIASDLVRNAIDYANHSATPAARWPLPALLAGTRFIAAALSSHDSELSS